MANHFSALKRARQTTKRTATNRTNTSRLRTALRTLRETIEKGDKASRRADLPRNCFGARQSYPEGHVAQEYGRPL